MRVQINKLKRGNSTKAERRFMELCKQLHIPFKTKVMIGGREIDFLIGSNAIEIDSHLQDPTKNSMLLNLGYSPFHFFNWEVNDSLIEFLKHKWQERVYKQVSEQT